MLLAVFTPEETASQNATALQPEATETISEAKESVMTEIEVPSATYPVTVVKTGLDFQYTYDGELQVYPDKTVITATWKPQCGETTSVDYQTQRFTYTLPTGSSQMTTENEYSDCMGKSGIRTESDPYRVDADGTIRVDLIEPSDGSLIREDFIIITGGPSPKGELEAELPEPETESYEPERTTEPEPAYEPGSSTSNEPGGGLSDLAQYSTCSEFNDAGLGNFTPGHPSYTSKRDRDGDGIACEF